MTDKECDRECQRLLDDLLCTDCKAEPRSPKYSTWGMCEMCGDVVAKEMAQWEADQKEFNEYEALRISQLPKLSRWQILVWRLDGRKWLCGHTEIAYFFGHCEDLLFHILIFPVYCHITIGKFTLALGQPIEYEPDGQTW